jgi:hypothetical protein
MSHGHGTEVIGDAEAQVVVRVQADFDIDRPAQAAMRPHTSYGVMASKGIHYARIGAGASHLLL